METPADEELHHGGQNPLDELIQGEAVDHGAQNLLERRNPREHHGRQKDWQSEYRRRD